MDVDYYRIRAEQERAAAMTVGGEASRQHTALACAYEDRARWLETLADRTDRQTSDPRAAVPGTASSITKA